MLRHFWSYLVYFMFKKIFLWLVWLNISYKQSFFFFLYQYSKFFSHFRNISCICFTAQESFSLGIYCFFFFWILNALLLFQLQMLYSSCCEANRKICSSLVLKAQLVWSLASSLWALKQLSVLYHGQQHSQC